STIKSLRRQGSEVACEASSRLRSEPWKYCSSVRTESAAAPACSNSRASSATGKSARINPFDGDAFFNSEMIAGPEPAIVLSRLRKPRVWWAQARTSKPGRSAEDLLSDTRTRAAVMISSSLLAMLEYTCSVLQSGVERLSSYICCFPQFVCLDVSAAGYCYRLRETDCGKP